MARPIARRFAGRRLNARLNARLRKGVAGAAGAVRVETLEGRRMLCVLHDTHVTALRSDLIGKQTQVAESADIVWTNRGQASDGFDSTFGTKASLARGVVDAVIVSYERMIGSFNYGVAGMKYSLTLGMDGGTGFGASAGSIVTTGNIPSGGRIRMGTGATDSDANSDNNWFLDPTPFDSSEFMGSINNAFAMDASGGGAVGRSDFFTVVAAELTHCMGQFPLTNWNAHTTNTGVSDPGLPGKLWLFSGADIQHLMTSDNGGSQDFGSAVHTSEPHFNSTTQSYDTLTTGGVTYNPTNDQGNAIYEVSRRYGIDYIHALMFKDAFAYSSVNPAQYGTAYSILNETTKAVTVRGGDFAAGAPASNDVINITRSGNTVFVSVDAGYDVPGTGASAGAGNLPAWVTQYDISQVNSISIQAGGGDDTISIPSDLGVPVTIDGGTGTDSVTFAGTFGPDAFVASDTGISSATTTLTVTGGVESLNVNGGGAADTFNVTGASTSTPLTLNGDDSDDVFTMTSDVNGASLTINGGNNNDALSVSAGFGGAIVFNGGAGIDSATTEASDGIDTVNLSSTNVNGGGNSLSYSGVESLIVNARSGNDTIVVDGTGLTLAVTVSGGVGNDTMTIANLAGGNLTYNAGTGTDSVTVNSTSTWNVNNDLGAGGQIVNVTSPGTVRFNVSQRLNNFNLTSSGRGSVANNGSLLLTVKSFTVAANAQLDLANNDMIVLTSSPAARAIVEGYVKKGYNFGGFDGLGGIISSAALNNAAGNTTLGLLSGADFANNNGGTFDGATPATNDSLIKYTYFGDVDFNGAVDSTDYNIIDFGFLTGASGWANGDVDYNGAVDSSDYNLIDFAFASQVGVY